MAASMTPDLPFLKKPVTGNAAEPNPATKGIAAAEAHPFGEGSTDWRSGWIAAPEYDEDHPEELSYRPFPVAPLLTQSASADDEALVKIVHPNLQRTLDMLDDKDIVLPMRLRTGEQVSGVAWAQQFHGSAVDFSAQHNDDAARVASGLTSRPVRTTTR
jgi:hypothetical protein